MEEDTPRHYESFTRLFLQNERVIRAYVRAMVTSDEGVEDILQEVALVAWRKFSELQERESFGRWACVIARYEVLKWRRQQSRDRLVFSERTLELLSATELENVELRERERLALEWCLKNSSEAERALVMAVHVPGASVAHLAEKHGRQAKRLYRQAKRLYRQASGLRQALMRCVKSRLAEET